MPSRFMRSLLFCIMILLMTPIIVYAPNAIRGINGDRIYNPAMYTLLVAGTICYHAYMVSTILRYNRFLAAAIVSGAFSGIVLMLAARVGLVIAYLLLAPDKKLGTMEHIFIDSWHFYLWMALLGIVCMSIQPLYKMVFRRG